MKKNLLVIALSLLSIGCTFLVSNATSNFSNNLAASILNQDDPEIVRDGLPTLILTMDSLISGAPDNPDLLAAGASLYVLYDSIFVDDNERSLRLTDRARGYGLRAMCLVHKPSCVWPNINYDEFLMSLNGIDPTDANILLSYGLSSLAYLRVRSTSWDTIAEFPQIQKLFDHYLEVSGDDANASAYTYIGIMHSLRPPMLGGKPELARMYFEKAIAESNGYDLSAKLEYARYYARLMYERELHDQLLNEILNADPNHNGFILTNRVAQKEAIKLLAEADDYF
ncbi:MAG: hypothetical protein CMQ54_03715 [Gammaproteobacteria bacterium]|nr:hypothetical protein [Gammaproteobacteria bacterium]|tara:strand:- start:2018 stop:2866 length:849 start_codon:yes stop_codon:yes gene_type:complete